MIKEWDMLRGVACLSILLLHVSTWILIKVGVAIEHEVYEFVRIALCYATPTFIVLSIIIMANRYPKQLPTGFWASRLQFLFIPFLVGGFFNALFVEMIYRKGLLFDTFINNVLYGEFVGWFVIVILQLYAIFALMKRFKWSPAWFLPLCVVISFIHHAIIELPYPFFENNTNTLRLLFTGWLGYFAIAYVIGTYYTQIAVLAKKYRMATIFLVLLSGVFLYIRMQLGYTEVHSRRLDLVPLVLSITLFVIAWGQSIPYMAPVRIISKYAFVIYLMHWEVLRFSTEWFVTHFDHTFVRVPLLFLWTLLVCIVLGKLLSMLPGSQWIVGKIKTHKS